MPKLYHVRYTSNGSRKGLEHGQRKSAEGWSTGQFPDGHLISENMPIKYLEKMNDDDFRAIYAYLQQVGPLPANK